MRSVLYWHPYIYSFLVRLMYRKHYTKRYEAITSLIDSNSSVLDVCCGDSKLYFYLRGKNVDYLGLDLNPTFVRVSKRSGIQARMFDLYKDVPPKKDFVVIQASLYQFIPDHNEILQKLFSAAKRYLIVAEPIRSYAQSKWKVVSLLGKLLNNPAGDGIYKVQRFNLDTLKETMRPFEKNIVEEFMLPGSIEYVFVVKKCGAASDVCLE